MPATPPRAPPANPAASTRAFDVLVLVASAGGERTVVTVLSGLAPDFTTPILLMQHLPEGSSSVDFYRGRTKFDVEWAAEAASLSPRKVLVSPPRSFVELLPDGSCRLTRCERGAIDRPMNRLLASVARSFAHRAIGVVLTGMGDDGAMGARELYLAGGRVLVQSEASAVAAEMPRAAIASGAADLVVPLRDIAQVITELVAGTPRPRARSELAAIRRIFGDDGELAACAREIDWALTPLGPVIDWPTELAVTARTAVESAQPTAVWWGENFAQIYNEPWRRFLGARKHPEALGHPARETWPEIWDEIGPMVERVMKHGASVGGEDHRIVIDRQGYPEEVYFTFSFTPIRDASGAVVGIHHTASETTPRIVAERRLALLHRLASQVTGAGTPREACERASEALVAARLDLPFALFYLFDKNGSQATLVGAAGATQGSRAAPYTTRLSGEQAVWPLERLLEKKAGTEGLLLDDLSVRIAEPGSPPGPSAELRPHSALVLPLRLSANAPAAGALVLALSPNRAVDDAYRSFCELIAQQVNAAMIEATAKRLERERTDRLAELDRAKTEFFANVSHEFRTPLTLLLTPLEEILRRRDQLPVALASEIEVAARNSRRLLRLVNNLLDFSEIETRRQRAVVEPTDLGLLTTDIASAFRAAIESAGLSLRVSCDPALPPVPANRDMWEKVVSNLLSNALKFTFEGEISVSLNALSLHAELVVSDTGIGIPEDELPHLFKRFHRVRGAKARTLEGSGIGLAIVHDLVERMGGQLSVRSIEHRGTSFRIWLPYRSYRQQAKADVAPAAAPVTGMLATDLADEASRWVAGASVEPEGVAGDLLGNPSELPAGSEAVAGRLLVVDDNADLRDYLRRLLSPRWNVEVAADGASALQMTRLLRPDVVLADVMMPGLDGFALLRQIREDPALKNTPVILLTARAGEEAAIEGLVAGADDYIAKPFSPRELVARVRGQVELSRTRRRAEELNTFLVGFSDAVRGVGAPGVIAQIACRMMVERLGADRSHCVVVDWATKEYVVEGSFSVGGRPSLTDRFPMDAWEPFTSAYMAGDSMIVDDARNDTRIPAAAKERLVQMGVGAQITVPVRVDGTFHATLSVIHGTPRRWAPEEIALVEGVAGRCWAEIERARAEATLRESEEKYRTLFETMGQGYGEIRLLRDEGGRAVDWLYLALNPAAEHVFGTGTSAGELVGRKASETTPDFVLWLEDFDRISKSGLPARIERAGTQRSWYEVHVQPKGSDRLVALYDDITERKERERRQAFMLKLSDTLRPLYDATAIQVAASALLRAHFDVARSYYTEIDDDAGVAHIRAESAAPGAPSTLGRYGLREFKAVIDGLRTGTPFVRDDWEGVAVSDSAADTLSTRRIQAQITIPLVKNGKLVGTLAVNDMRPRRWTTGDVELVTETAERTWAAVEQARTEAALRESQARVALELSDMQELQRVSSRLLEHDAVDAPYGRLLDTARSLMRSEMASIQKLVGERKQLRLLAQHGLAPESARFWEWVSSEHTTCCGLAMATGEPIVVPDVESWDFVAGTQDLAHYRLSGIRAILSTPLVSRTGKLVGMLSVHWRDVHRPSERESRVFDVLARQAADLLERRDVEAARTEAQKTLQESETRFRAFVTAGADVLYRMSPDWSEMRTLDGRGSVSDTPEPTSAWMSRCIHPDDHAEMVAEIRRAVRAKQMFQLEHRARRADGSLGWTLSRAIPILDERGEVVEWLGSATDLKPSG